MRGSAIVLGVFLMIMVPALVSGAAAAAEKCAFGELTALADTYGSDKGSTGNKHTEVYEYFFLPMKETARKICEIGIAEGASLKMFADYFPRAVVYGIDIVDSTHMETARMKTFVADQGNRAALKAFLDTYGSDYDIILDDGGHGMKQQQTSFGVLFRHVAPGGYYIIEDLGTSLMGAGEFEINEAEDNTTLGMIFDFIKTGKIASEYLSPSEEEYLRSHITYCNLLYRNGGKIITCIFKKR